MVIVVVDQAGGSPRRSSFELISAGRQLAEARGLPLAALVAAGQEEGPGLAETLAAFVPQVLLVADPALAAGGHEPRTRAIAEAAKANGAQVVLMAASRSGQAVAPRVAMRLGAALLEDVTALRPEAGALEAERLAYLSRAVQTVRSSEGPVVVSVKLGAFPPAGRAEQAGEVRALSVGFTPADTAVQQGARQQAERGRVALEEAELVVCGGRGLGDAAAFEKLAVGLADQLGAGVAATRAVVDAGWRPYAEQVGQTGKSVAPKLYLGLAVSGAVQHLSGMNRSGTVVAINKDPDAPIFKAADYAVVGDVHEVVPALLAALAGLD